MLSSTPAITLLIVYILIIVLSTVTIIINKQFRATTVLGILLSLGFVALIVYDTECLSAGGCTIWSWIRTVLYIIVPSLILIGLAYALASGKFTVSDTQPTPQIAVATPVISSPVPLTQENNTTTTTTTPTTGTS